MVTGENMKSKKHFFSPLKSGFAGLFVFAIACLLDCCASAADVYWAKSHGGDMQDDGNWRDGKKPQSTDWIKIGINNDAPITLSEDLSATGGNSVFGASFEFALTNSAGVPKTLSLKRLLPGGGKKTNRLSAGTLSFYDNFYMGDQSTAYHDDAFFVDGASAVLSGVNSSLFVGAKNYNNILCVTNGGTVLASALDVGRNQWNENYVSTNNCFRVTGAGSTAVFSSVVNLGSSGLCRIEVLDGGCLTTTNFYVRRSRYLYDNIVWHGGHSILLSGAGSKVTVNGQSNSGFWLGNSNAPDCSATVEKNAVWESYGEFKIADGAVTNARFRVASGASVFHHVYSLYVGTGDKAVNAVLEIDNGTVVVFDRDVNVNGEGGRISISGAGARLSAKQNFNLKDNTSLNIEIPVGGFTGGVAPVTIEGTFKCTAASTVSVALAEGWNRVAPGTYRIVLAEASSISDTGFTLDLPDDTDMVKVTRDLTNAKQLAVNVKVLGGLKIIVR